jgi:phosphatidate cytidylyltransferase
VAFNWQTFKTRTLTAAVFVVVMLVGLLWNQWSFFILFSVIHFGCWWEYLKLIERIHNIRFPIFSRLVLMLIGYGILIFSCYESYQFGLFQIQDKGAFLLVFVAAFAFLILILGILQKGRLLKNPLAAAAVGLVYISLSCGLMIDLYHSFFDGRNGKGTYIFELVLIIPLAIIFTLWVNDTMAYIVGSLIGKTKMTEISPKKTWEGTIGGALLSTLLLGFLSSLYSEKYLANSLIKNYHWYIISLITAIMGTIGDLFESKLKRMAGVKDSGHIMPGHGGFLDRFDSLLFATPFVWFYVYFLMK